MRVIDANLLTNGGFEIRDPTGRDSPIPGWRSEPGGARIVTEVANVRSRTRALAVDGDLNVARGIAQDIHDLPVAPHIRVSAWIKTLGLSRPLILRLRFNNVVV